MTDRISEIITELNEITRVARAHFDGLTREELNWKPNANSWSVAQCLDHLIRLNSLYFPLFSSLGTGPVKQTFVERYSPFSGMMGRLMIGAMSPENQKKTKTRPKAEPSASDLDGILESFVRHQAELIGLLGQIPESVNLERTIVTSPLAGWVTYSLDDCLTILVLHEKRHLQQARRVLEAEERSRGGGAADSGSSLRRSNQRDQEWLNSPLRATRVADMVSCREESATVHGQTARSGRQM